MPDTAGTVRRNADTGEVAVRSSYDEDVPELAPMAWVVLHPWRGVRHAPSAEAQSWDLLFESP